MDSNSGLKSLVLVTVDCLRADHAGFLGYSRPTTPFLDSLTPESLVFSNAIVAGSPTFYSFPAIMASRFPLAFGRDVIGLAPEEATLSTTLKQSGYATAAFVAGNPYLSARFGYDAGFDVFRDFLDAGPIAQIVNEPESARTRLNRAIKETCHQLGPVGPVYDELYFRYCQRSVDDQSFDELRRYPAADVIVDEATAWLTCLAKKPFFLWLHLMDPHAPYYPTEKALGWMGDAEITSGHARYLNSYWNREGLSGERLMRYREEIIALYDAGIRWADAQLARMVDTLKTWDLWDDCVFAVTADHGEEFLEHGERFHPPSHVFEELVKVPLLVRAPGNAAKRVDQPFSLVHLAPTLLDAAGVIIPDAFRGLSCFRHPELCDYAATECAANPTDLFCREGRMGPRVLAIRESRYKLVLNFEVAQEQLFDLDRDTGEQNPLPPDAEKAVRARLLKRAQQHLARSEAADPQEWIRATLREIRLEATKTLPSRTDAVAV